MNQAKRNLLIAALVARPNEHTIQKKGMETEANLIAEKTDWLWHLLLSAMSTMGNSRGYEGLIKNIANYQLVSYKTIKQLDAGSRLSNLFTGLKRAKVRRPLSKSTWLNNNFQFIQECGGLNTVQNFLSHIKGRESKIRFIKLFEGIGDKYARNIFMEIFHPDFINSIAIDERIKDISDALEIDSSKISYAEHENILIEMAISASLTPWQMDRLLYSFKSYYLNAIKNGA